MTDRSDRCRGSMYQRDLFDRQMDLMDQLHDQHSPLWAEPLTTPSTMDTRKFTLRQRLGHVDGFRVEEADGSEVAILKGTQDATASELVRRWNAYPEAIDRIHDLLETAGRVEDMMDGDRDKQEAWAEELGRLYVAIDEARALLETLKA